VCEKEDPGSGWVASKLKKGNPLLCNMCGLAEVRACAAFTCTSTLCLLTRMRITNIELMYIIGPLLAASVPRSEVLRARVRSAGVQKLVQEQERGDAGRAAVQQMLQEALRRGAQEGAQGMFKSVDIRVESAWFQLLQ